MKGDYESKPKVQVATYKYLSLGGSNLRIRQHACCHNDGGSITRRTGVAATPRPRQWLPGEALPEGVPSQIAPCSLSRAAIGYCTSLGKEAPDNRGGRGDSRDRAFGTSLSRHQGHEGPPLSFEEGLSEMQPRRFGNKINKIEWGKGLRICFFIKACVLLLQVYFEITSLGDGLTRWKGSISCTTYSRRQPSKYLQ